MLHGAFVTATGTGVGKTYVTRGLARSFARRGLRTLALKPIETGVAPTALDALALARACEDPSAADATDFYRAVPPLSPRGATLYSHVAPPDLSRILRRIHELGARADALLIEGAGGILVPLDARATMADLAAQVNLPLVMVAANELGTLSHVLTAIEAADIRGLSVVATVLVSRADPTEDPSVRTNRQLLSERLDHAVLAFPRCADDDDALADAADGCGLTSLLGIETTSSG